MCIHLIEINQSNEIFVDFTVMKKTDTKADNIYNVLWQWYGGITNQSTNFNLEFRESVFLSSFDVLHYREKYFLMS